MRVSEEQLVQCIAAELVRRCDAVFITSAGGLPWLRTSPNTPLHTLLGLIGIAEQSLLRKCSFFAKAATLQVPDRMTQKTDPLMPDEADKDKPTVEEAALRGT